MNGLTSEKANELLAKYGQNVITEGKKKTLLQKFIEQFNNFLTLLLIGAGGLSFIIGEPVDGALIIAIVILNALFGIYQEAKAEQSIAALKKISVAKVRVIRDGIEQEIESNYIVPGDICIIEEGVKIAADGILVESRNIELDESLLTGESIPIAKKTDDEVFSGTLVAKGRGVLRVVSTGMQTKFGQIAHHLSLIEENETPLQKKLRALTRMIGIIGVAAAGMVFVISIVQGAHYFPAFLLSISLAVAIVPEGLPAVMTITLAIGVHEMSKKKSIVRKLSAIEALGSVTLIATDKTGTLTTNKMKVAEVFVDDMVYKDELPRLENHPFSLLVRNGILCSTASLVYKHDKRSHDILGDPTEGALLIMATELGLEIEEERKKYSIIDEQPFDSVTKRMSVIVEGPEQIQYTKGAPESILEISTSIQKGTQIHPLIQEERKKIENQMDKWARRGLRVLAFSYKPVPTNSTGSTFLGMVAIHDAPRPEVRDAVLQAQSAGIRVVMITGDNERTAEAIGVVAGIVTPGCDVLTGTQLEQYSDEELLQILPTTNIFARTSPFHKHRIVSLFQKLGEVVAVTGDGVNDAIALKQADVGIAMGLVGTDVARETADMVITDDNFASIVVAIEEGRNIIKNIKNAIQYLLACNIAEAITLIGGLLLGFTHILNPIQLLYINLITDGVPALSLAFSPRSSRMMREKPQQELELLNKKEQTYIACIGILTGIIILASYILFRNVSDGIARSAAFSVLILIQSFILIDLWLSHRPIHTHLKALVSPLFLFVFFFPFVLQLIILRVPVLSKVFSVSQVSWGQFGIFILISALILGWIRMVKSLLA